MTVSHGISYIQNERGKHILLAIIGIIKTVQSILKNFMKAVILSSAEVPMYEAKQLTANSEYCHSKIKRQTHIRRFKKAHSL